jgi:hypothetical protein
MRTQIGKDVRAKLFWRKRQSLPAALTPTSALCSFSMYRSVGPVSKSSSTSGRLHKRISLHRSEWLCPLLPSFNTGFDLVSPRSIRYETRKKPFFSGGRTKNAGNFFPSVAGTNPICSVFEASEPARGSQNQPTIAPSCPLYNSRDGSNR